METTPDNAPAAEGCEGPAASGSPPVAWPTWLCALSPAVLLLALISAAVIVRVRLGHWPTFGEGVSGPAWRWIEFILIWNFITSAFVALPVGLLLVCFPALRGGGRFHGGQLGVFLGAWLLIFLWVWWDPARFMHWLLD